MCKSLSILLKLNGVIKMTIFLFGITSNVQIYALFFNPGAFYTNMM